jgi:hypothetical protein
MSVPQMTDEQRKAALESAMRARAERADLKARVKSGEVSVEAVLGMDIAAAEGMRVAELIKSCPGYGDARAKKLMAELGIPENRRVRGLGSRQREALVKALKG